MKVWSLYSFEPVTNIVYNNKFGKFFNVSVYNTHKHIKQTKTFYKNEFIVNKCVTDGVLCFELFLFCFVDLVVVIYKIIRKRVICLETGL